MKVKSTTSSPERSGISSACGLTDAQIGKRHDNVGCARREAVDLALEVRLPNEIDGMHMIQGTNQIAEDDLPRIRQLNFGKLAERQVQQRIRPCGVARQHPDISQR